MTIAGREVGAYLVWGEANAANPMLDMIIVQPGVGINTGGPIVVTVNGAASNADVTFTSNAGRVHYVSASGTDAPACTEAAPCKTIQHAMRDVARGGDTVLVRGPALDEGEIWLQASHAGATAARKVVKAYPGERVRLPNASRPFIIGDEANYITVAGFDFENGKSLGVGYDHVVGVHALDNTFKGVIDWDAIGVHGDSIVLAGNVCLVSGSTVGTQGHCYYISHSSGVQIRYNIGAGAPGYGLHIFDQRRSSADYRRVIRDVLVDGNIFRHSTLRDGMIIAMADEGGLGNTIERVTIRNNVFAANNHNGLRIGADAGATIRDVTIHGNTFYRNGRQGLHLFNGAATGELSFVAPDAYDLRPRAGSAVIDAADALPGLLRDFLGVPRPRGAGIDFGAFEAGS